MSPSETAVSADLGGSSNYSNENFEGRVEMVSMRTVLGHGLAGPKSKLNCF